MNLCGSFGGGGTTREVEPDCCLLVGIDFRGAMVVDLGLGFYKHKKRGEREREERATKFEWGGGNENPFEFLKDSKIAPATSRRMALCYGEAWLRSGVELYAVAYPIVW